MLLLLFAGWPSSSGSPVKRGAFYPTPEEWRLARLEREEREQRLAELEARIAQTIEEAWDLVNAPPPSVESTPQIEAETVLPEEPPAPQRTGKLLTRQVLALLLAPLKKPTADRDEEYELFAEQLAEYERGLRALVDDIDAIVLEVPDGDFSDVEETLKAMAESREYRRIKKYLDA